MAEFQELIKNFDRIRDYMRQFYIYGFKVRNEYEAKSARTYDNERRRIESWLAEYTESDYTAKGKQVYINVDSRTIPQNPLYAAWKAKSFTDNDIMLHFFLLDLLAEEENACGLNAGELGDRISQSYGVVFDSQTIRLKLKEYEALGLLEAEKQGKTLLYRMKSGFFSDEKFQDQLLNAIQFYQGAAPFGFIGSTILDQENRRNEWFQFKHHFIVHTLEDGILSDILAAIRNQNGITFINKSVRSGNQTVLEGIPLRIFVSTRTGRRYVCCYLERKRRLINLRLDCITQVEIGAYCRNYENLRQKLEDNLVRCWGVSFGGSSRLEEVCIKLYIDEEREPYILNRLYREGRGGEIQRVRENEYLYSGVFFDTNEMLTWIKTFTGRVLDIQGSSQPAITKLLHDWEKMYRMYCTEEQQEDADGTI